MTTSTNLNFKRMTPKLIYHVGFWHVIYVATMMQLGHEAYV